MKLSIVPIVAAAAGLALAQGLDSDHDHGHDHEHMDHHHHTYDAPIIVDNVPRTTYVADIKGSHENGRVISYSDPTGLGTIFRLKMNGLSPHEGPYTYHIHEKPVKDADCGTTGEHLDPYHNGVFPECDPNRPETCQLGDLSGKHNNVTQNSSSKYFLDIYLSTTPGNIGFFGNRSIVIHDRSNSRIACGNFKEVQNARPVKKNDWFDVDSDSNGQEDTHRHGHDNNHSHDNDHSRDNDHSHDIDHDHDHDSKHDHDHDHNRDDEDDNDNDHGHDNDSKHDHDHEHGHSQEHDHDHDNDHHDNDHHHDHDSKNDKGDDENFVQA
ncbi:uncharacterized protein BROUX77_002020 [Berkeleyomyces rouxiae]|uniref:uncharacterized protein n=1 Tax=Berkeleyomyces rouxiae TaxID=2035830 RepID=UPI003B7B7C7E